MLKRLVFQCEDCSFKTDAYTKDPARQLRDHRRRSCRSARSANSSNDDNEEFSDQDHVNIEHNDSNMIHEYNFSDELHDGDSEEDEEVEYDFAEGSISEEEENSFDSSSASRSSHEKSDSEDFDDDGLIFEIFIFEIYKNIN